MIMLCEEATCSGEEGEWMWRACMDERTTHQACRSVFTQTFDNRSTKGEVGYKVSIHNIQMNEISAGFDDACRLSSQVAHIRGK